MKNFKKILIILYIILFSLSLPFGSWLGSKWSSQAQQLKHNGLAYYVTQGINVKTTGTVTLFTTDTGARFHPLFAIVEITASSSLTLGATVSVGSNSASFNNVLAATTTGTTTNSMLPNPLSASADSVAPGTDVKANITIAATGTSGTLTIVVFGCYF